MTRSWTHLTIAIVIIISIVIRWVKWMRVIHNPILLAKPNIITRYEISINGNNDDDENAAEKETSWWKSLRNLRMLSVWVSSQSKLLCTIVRTSLRVITSTLYITIRSESVDDMLLSFTRVAMSRKISFNDESASSSSNLQFINKMRDEMKEFNAFKDRGGWCHLQSNYIVIILCEKTECYLQANAMIRVSSS